VGDPNASFSLLGTIAESVTLALVKGFARVLRSKHRRVEMATDDGWQQVWAEISGEDLRDRLQDYRWLAANGPNSHAGRIAQLAAEAERRDAFGSNH